MPGRAAASSVVDVRRAGSATSRSKPNGDCSVATVAVAAPGWSEREVAPRYASKAALPSAAAVSPYTRGLGDSG